MKTKRRRLGPTRLKCIKGDWPKYLMSRPRLLITETFFPWVQRNQSEASNVRHWSEINQLYSEPVVDCHACNYPRAQPFRLPSKQTKATTGPLHATPLALPFLLFWMSSSSMSHREGKLSKVPFIQHMKKMVFAQSNVGVEQGMGLGWRLEKITARGRATAGEGWFRMLQESYRSGKCFESKAPEHGLM